MRFFQQFWQSGKKQKRSIFGGIVKSDAEIKALNRKILAHEKREAEAVENELEEVIKNL
jgi:hypothetical protein